MGPQAVKRIAQLQAPVAGFLSRAVPEVSLASSGSAGLLPPAAEPHLGLLSSDVPTERHSDGASPSRETGSATDYTRAYKSRLISGRAPALGPFTAAAGGAQAPSSMTPRFISFRREGGSPFPFSAAPFSDCAESSWRQRSPAVRSRSMSSSASPQMRSGIHHVAIDPVISQAPMVSDAPLLSPSLSQRDSLPMEFQKLVELSQSLRSSSSGDGALPIADAQQLFSKLSTPELANALLNLELASNELVVDAATAVLSSPRIMTWRTLASPLLWAVKRTAHAHFCAGETVEEACRTLERMWSLGLRGILDFSVEDAHDEETCDRNLQGFLRTIGHTRSLPPSSVSYACVKLTALCPLPVLEHASSILRMHHQQPGTSPPAWMRDSLPVLVDASPAHSLSPEAAAPLSGDEVKSLEAAYERLRKICLACREQGVPLLIDAEYQSVEPIIDHLAFAAAVEFNRPGDALPLVYATVQCYLKDAFPRLQRSYAEAHRRGVPFGVKLVRGAYLMRETQEAEAQGRASHVFQSIQDTHRCYDTCAAFMIAAAAEGARSLAKPQAAVVLATHNYSSGRRAVLCSEEAGLPRTDPRLQFAQLKGMADGLSLTLALSGYNVSKYLPYGKVEEVMPYLLRRAQENRGVLGNTKDERKRIWTELKRRLFGIQPRTSPA